MAILGQVITRQQAEDEIETFLLIRKETYPVVKAVVDHLSMPPLPEGSRTYYSDIEISFVFDRESIEKVFSMGGSACNGIRVY